MKTESSNFSKTTPWDVIVIGGGATGAGTARDCARRGLRTLCWNGTTSLPELRCEKTFGVQRRMTQIPFCFGWMSISSGFSAVISY
ncbi:MAG: hypothetical protein LBP34_05650 [Flavobacteriaceae bacterium]|nr:hypothetical protein [Flavobacteriaceae bacterium]